MVRALAVVAAGSLLVACGSSGSTPVAGTTPSASASATSTAKPKPKHRNYPTGPAMTLESVVPVTGTTVGVAMPISIVFANPVATSARQQIENHIAVTSSTPMIGAWHWFSSRRVDFRPKTFWKPGTTVSMVAHFNHLADGNGDYGRQDYATNFTIGADVETRISVPNHLTQVYENGKLIRSMPSDAGSSTWPSWDGTMAVVEKLPSVTMTSCSVDIACSPSDPSYYNITLPWDVRLTWSGTFVHYSTGDPYPGHSSGTHGCVHLSLADSKWFYDLAKIGDPVIITGSPRGKADGDNGYAGFNLTWPQWLAGSARGQFTT
ncbi:MAG TPA: L,D-transpeptidase [Marmoricola sp.]|nr:L,D-transpeptidase [Marmoricola sp.]